MFKHATSSCRLHVNISTYGSAGQLCAVNFPSPVQVSLPATLGDPAVQWRIADTCWKCPGPKSQSNTCASPVRGKKLTLAAWVEHDWCTHCRVFIFRSYRMHYISIKCLLSFSFYYTSLTVPVPMRRLQTVLLFSHSSHRFRRDSAAGVYVNAEGLTELLKRLDWTCNNICAGMSWKTLRRKNTHIYICILRLYAEKNIYISILSLTLTHTQCRGSCGRTLRGSCSSRTESFIERTCNSICARTWRWCAERLSYVTTEKSRTDRHQLMDFFNFFFWIIITADKAELKSGIM